MTNLHYLNNWNNQFPQLSLPLPNFNWNGGFNSFGNGIFNFPTVSSPAASSTANESYEEYSKRIQAELEVEKNKNKTYSEERALSDKKTEEIKPLQENINEINKQITNIKSVQKKDGSAIVRPKNKELGFWGKAGRWLGNAGSALKNMAKGLAGFEADGSWNWKKCLRNVAITTAAVAACFIPVVGPAIGYGLAAMGVAGAGVGIIKGAGKLKEAKTEEEIDKAQQDICANAFIGITSAFGLRGVKGLKSVMKAEYAAVKGSGLGGFFKAWGSNISNAVKSFNNWENRYEDKYSSMKASVNKKIADIDLEINKINRTVGGDRAKQHLLYEERNALLKEWNTLRTFKGVKTKTDLDALANTCSKDIKKLIKYRENMMRTKAQNPDKYASELAEYIPTSDVKSRWYKPSTWRKNEYQLAIGGKNPGCYKEIAGLALTSQASTVPKFLGEYDRTYSGPMLMSVELNAEQAKQTLEELEAEKAKLEAQIAGIKNIDLATYKQALAKNT